MLAERPLHVVLWSAAGGVLFAALLVAQQARQPALRMEMQAAGELPRAIASGFHDPETDGDGVTFRWTSDRSTLRLTALDRRSPWRLRVRVRAPRAPAPEFSIDVDGRTLHRAPAPQTYTELAVDLPARTPAPRVTPISLVTNPAVVPGPGDQRQLGLQIDWLTIEPADGAWPRPPNGALFMAVLAGLALGASIGCLALPTLAALACLALAAAINAALVTHGTAILLPYVSTNARIAALVAVAAAGITLAAESRVRRRLSIAARAAIAAWAVLSWTKIALVLHPAMFIGDVGFHFNRLAVVQRGEYFFTSEGPSGSFPYPVAYYVLVSWMGGWAHDPALLLRLVLAIADVGVCALAYPLLVRAGGDRLRAAAASAALALTPALFHIQAVAYLTNGFGNLTATAALLAIAAPAAGLALILQPLALFVLTLTTLLSHVSSGVILVATLGLVAILLAWTGRRGAGSRLRDGALIAAVTLAAGAVSYGVYYARFTDTFEAARRGGGRPPATAAEIASPPAQRIEPHQTRFVPGHAALVSRLAAVPRYAQRSYGVPLMLLALWGIVAAWRARPHDQAALVLAAWLATCLAFFALAMLTPIDLRYYLAAAPVMALLAGGGLADLLRRPPIGRVAAMLLGCWLLAHALSHDFSWLA